MPAPTSTTGSPTHLEALSNDLVAAVERAERSLVAIHARRRIPSSGIHWGDGIVASANHTIHLDEDITVTLPDGAEVSATLLGRDPTTDLAALRLGGSAALSAAERASDDAIRTGTLVLALGRPGRTVTASLGIISAVGGEWRTWHGGRIDRFVRLDLSIYDGFSGGPLVNAAGQVVGLNTSGLARAAAVTIPVATVERVVRQLAEGGRVARGFLGLGMQPVRIPEAAVRRLELDSDVGLMVVSIATHGPAEQASIFLGDVLVRFDDAPVSDPAELLARLEPERIGTTAAVRILRAGELIERAITIGERPLAREPVRQRGGRRP